MLLLLRAGDGPPWRLEGFDEIGLGIAAIRKQWIAALALCHVQRCGDAFLRRAAGGHPPADGCWIPLEHSAAARAESDALIIKTTYQDYVKIE